jgi:NAD(P)-dependent dehydrogenase (short-subunit alcohol dehydrogenase family)
MLVWHSGSVKDEDWMRCYQSNVMAHLWLMQDLQEELKKNQGSFTISASIAGLKAVGSSMVSTSRSRI